MTRRPALLMLSSLICACGAEGAPPADGELHEGRDPVAAVLRGIRPTDGTGWNNNGFGIPAQFYDPPGGHFRVYYVTTSENAVDPADVAPMDGVPDFPQIVGEVAESTYKSTIAIGGFRPPLDDSIYHDRPDYGGDGRFDIYLRWVGPGSDGYRVSEVCTDGSDGGSPGRCAGYFVMNPSFTGTSYPSERAAIEVLVSHELFHNVQDAYNAGQWRTWTEGTAVWNELQVFPQSAGTFRDYLGFLRGLFNEPERPFDKSMGSGPAAAYAYGTAAWPEFLSERFEPAIIRFIWEACEQGPAGDAPNFLDATDAVLRGRYGSSLAEAWTEFTRWNLVTGARASADQTQGYKRAAEYPLMRLEPDLPAVGQSAKVELNGLSARYLRVRPALSEPTSLRIGFSDSSGAQIVAAAFLASTPDGALRSIGEVRGGFFDQVVRPGEALYFALTGAIRGAPTRAVQVSIDLTPSLGTNPSDTSGGCSLAHTSPGIGQAGAGSGAGGFAFALVLLLALVQLRRIRRDAPWRARHQPDAA